MMNNASLTKILEDGIVTEEEIKEQSAKVTAIAVDQNMDTITLVTVGAKNIRWTANGKTIATGNSIDLDDHKRELGN